MRFEDDVIEEREERRGGVRAVETMAALMQTLATARGPISLTDLAERSGIAPAKAHRYLASMAAAQFVSHRRSGLYDLGPAAAQIGIAALARVDAVNHFSESLSALVDTTGVPALVAVWTTIGATVTRWERQLSFSPMLVCPGTNLPVLRSAVGLAFLHTLPDRLLDAVLERESEGAHDAASARAASAGPGEDGLFRRREAQLDARYCAARPMLGPSGEPVCVLAVFGREKADVAPGSAAARALLALA